MKWIRTLYDWVIRWAETPYGAPALFVVSFVESSFFPIPPDVLLIALCLGARNRAFYFALVCSVGSVLGGIAGYGIGWGMWALVDQLFFAYVPGFSEETFNRVQALYEEWNFWIVFAAAFTPLPYKVITITAGVFGISFPMFVVASAVGRPARFYLVAGLIWLIGEPIRKVIDRHFNLLTVVFTVLLAGSFFLFKAMTD